LRINSTWYSSSAAKISAMTDSSRGWAQIDPFDKNSEVWRTPFGLDDLLAHHNTPLFSVAALRGIALLFPDRLLGTIENTGNNTACIPRGSPDSNH